MTDNQPANLDKQIDQILNDVWELGYSSRSHLGEPDFNEDTENIDQAKAAIQQLLVMARIDATQEFSGLWGIGGDDNEHVAIYRRVYSKEMAALQSQLTKQQL